MNIIWVVLITVSIIAAFWTGGLEAVTRAMFDGAKAAVEISLFLLGIVSLWLGITKIIEDSGLIFQISHAFRPLITKLFKTVPPDHPAITSITLNMLANFFGLGNAATPLGIKAMQDLQTLNEDKDSLTFEMMLFIVLNTASVQLIPFTVVGILSDFGSVNPSAIVFPTIISTVISAIIALGVLLLFRRLMK
ncbi:MAG: spore maturation protein [Syntrophales bacterium]|jgi:spore maturation protein A|nr:spore maturation protein [Syntrophales bacterium]MCK9390782.1 spore maturation protein [Syntrophales bacterium]